MRTKPYPHDRLLAATVLKLVPDGVRPNQITVLRILLTPLVVFVIWNEDYTRGIALFLLVAFTDMMDGSLARTRGQVTEWGMLWDPIADKLLIGSVALLLLFRHFPAELAILILGIEAAFLVGAYYHKRKGRIVAANWWGKMKMLMQVLGVTLYLLWLASAAGWLLLASFMVFGAAGAFAVLSFIAHGL